MAECSKYKTGEVPMIGDLVWRLRAVEPFGMDTRQYGIVSSYWLSGNRTFMLPVICWAGQGKPKKSLTGTVRLWARGNKNA